MKKLIQMFLLCALFVCTGCQKENATRTLIVGSGQFSGYFMPSEGLSSTYTDANIRSLLHGGELVVLDDEGKLVFNKSVIEKQVSNTDEQGNVTYTFTLKDMVWSDNTPITADDYLFAFLLAASPEYRDAGALDATGEGLLGYWEYYEEGGAFQGIQKIDDKNFSLTIDGNELPYFWELAYLGATPYPMHVLTQADEKLTSTATGTTFDGDMAKAVETFTTSYNTELNPTCGPYTFESYENGQVKLKRNPNYMGDENGKKPEIESILVKEIADETSMEALLAHEIDILEPVMEAKRIVKGKEAVEKGELQGVPYLRNGYGVVSIKNDVGATSETEVRRALGYMIDREGIIKEYMDGYGTIVNSDYAPMQWMYEEAKDDLQFPYTYAYSIKKANEQLDNSSYVFEADGVTPYNSELSKEGYYRYNKEKEVLSIQHMATSDNLISDVVEQQLTKSASQVGMKYQMQRSDDAGFQDAYYFTEAEAQQYNIFTLGTEYADIPDPYYASFSCDFVQTTANPSNYCDTKMDELIMNVRHSDPKDKEGYLKAWKEYLMYFNEQLPVLPLYSGEYYGFASIDLQGYQPTSYAGWSKQINNLSWK